MPCDVRAIAYAVVADALRVMGKTSQALQMIDGAWAYALQHTADHYPWHLINAVKRRLLSEQQ